MQYMTKKEVAAMLRVSCRSVDKWKAENGLPVIKIGGVCRYEKETVLVWFAGHQQKGEADCQE